MTTWIQSHLFAIMFLASVVAHASAVLVAHTTTVPPKLKGVQAGRASISLRSAATAGPKPSLRTVEKPREEKPPSKPVVKKEQPARKDVPKIAHALESVPPPPEEKPPEAVEEPKPTPSKNTPQIISDKTSAGSQGSAGSTGADVPSEGYPTNKAPVYPAEALQAGWEGIVVVLIRVDAQGRVARVHLHKSSGFKALDDAALEAAKEYEYEPARRGGVPVPEDHLQRFPFSIKSR